MGLVGHLIEDGLADFQFLAFQHGATEEYYLGLRVVRADLSQQLFVALLKELRVVVVG